VEGVSVASGVATGAGDSAMGGDSNRVYGLD